MGENRLREISVGVRSTEYGAQCSWYSTAVAAWGMKIHFLVLKRDWQSKMPRSIDAALLLPSYQSSRCTRLRSSEYVNSFGSFETKWAKTENSSLIGFDRRYRRRHCKRSTDPESRSVDPGNDRRRSTTTWIGSRVGHAGTPFPKVWALRE